MGPLTLSCSAQIKANKLLKLRWTFEQARAKMAGFLSLPMVLKCRCHIISSCWQLFCANVWSVKSTLRIKEARNIHMMPAVDVDGTFLCIQKLIQSSNLHLFGTVKSDNAQSVAPRCPIIAVMQLSTHPSHCAKQNTAQPPSWCESQALSKYPDIKGPLL